jgi:hypothetical protein
MYTLFGIIFAIQFEHLMRKYLCTRNIMLVMKNLFFHLNNIFFQIKLKKMRRDRSHFSMDYSRKHLYHGNVYVFVYFSILDILVVGF